MTAAFRTLVHLALYFLAAVAIWTVFGVSAGPWLVIAAAAAVLWPKPRRRCCDCDD